MAWSFIVLLAASFALTEAASVPCSMPSVNCRQNATCKVVLDRFHYACDDIINGRSSSCPVDGECYRNYTLLLNDPIGMDFGNCSCGSNVTCRYRHDNVTLSCDVMPTTVMPTTPTAGVPCLLANTQCTQNQACSKALSNFLNGDACSKVLSYSSGDPPVCTDDCRAAERALATNSYAVQIGLETCDCGALKALCTGPRENFARFCPMANVPTVTVDTTTKSSVTATTDSRIRAATSQSPTSSFPTSSALAVKAIYSIVCIAIFSFSMY